MKYGHKRLRVAAIIVSLALGYCSLVSAQEPLKIFSLQRPDSHLKKAPQELNEALIYGISWRFSWKTIEPSDGQFNWEPIDKSIEMTSSAGKKVMLRITAGINTPEWVYQAGAKAIEFSNADLARSANYPSSLRMPIPWDEVHLRKWGEFIGAFGQRYNRNPHIYSIQMTGGGYIGEMNLPKVYDKWQQVGYSDEKLIAAWKRIIDDYQKAFPDVPTNLDINEPLGRNRSNVLDPIVSYVLTTYPRKVYLQQNGLKADFPRESRIRQIIREASSKTIVGYQMVGGKGFLEKETGDRIGAFRNALEDRASYLEVYASDARDFNQRRALQFLSTPTERR